MASSFPNRGLVSPGLPAAPALWQQLQQVAQVVLAVRKGQSGSAALEAVPAALRPGVQALSFAVWRTLGWAQVLRQQLVSRTPAAQVDALLCSALALLHPQHSGLYDEHTLVNQAVEAAKKQRSTQAQAAFINACLRRCLRERAALQATIATHGLAQWSHPDWWVQRVQQDWPLHGPQVLAAAQQVAPLVLRVNVLRSSVAGFLQALVQAQVQAVHLGQTAVWLPQPVPVAQLPGYHQGWFSVQDAAAQLAAPLLLQAMRSAAPANRTGTAPWRVLDACAAPGGKTAHLLELADAKAGLDLDVLALDVDGQRTQRITQNLGRLGLQAHVRVADAALPQTWWDGQPWDAVLLDAPCSASGIVRRHPDIRWLRRQSDVQALVQTQARLLLALWPLLRQGGVLLYCTCSVFKAEGEDQVQRFLHKEPSARRLPAPGHLLPGPAAHVLLPSPAEAGVDNLACEHDGFYYALLQKTLA